MDKIKEVKSIPKGKLDYKGPWFATRKKDIFSRSKIKKFRIIVDRSGKIYKQIIKIK